MSGGVKTFRKPKSDGEACGRDPDTSTVGGNAILRFPQARVVPPSDAGRGLVRFLECHGLRTALEERRCRWSLRVGAVAQCGQARCNTRTGVGRSARSHPLRLNARSTSCSVPTMTNETGSIRPSDKVLAPAPHVGWQGDSKRIEGHGLGGRRRFNCENFCLIGKRRRRSNRAAHLLSSSACAAFRPARVKEWFRFGDNCTTSVHAPQRPFRVLGRFYNSPASSTKLDGAVCFVHS